MGTGLKTLARDIRFLMRIRSFRLAIKRGDWNSACTIWSNPSSVNPKILEHIGLLARELAKPKLTILECGSGLSTVLLSTLSKESGFGYRSFENSPRWARKTRFKALLAGLRVNVEQRKLMSYEHFDWYQLKEADPSTPFGLVICDGPPSKTLGGRYGLLPLLKDQLRGATIMLDDANRDEEKGVLERWRVEYGATYQIFSPTNEKAYAVVTIPENFPEEFSQVLKPGPL